MKLSFKKEKKLTGLSSVGYPYQNVDIKVNKKKVGYISAPTWNNGDLWRIRFSVVKKDIMEDGNPNCVWKWITLKVTFKNEDDAREYVKKIITLVQDKYIFQEL